MFQKLYNLEKRLGTENRSSRLPAKRPVTFKLFPSVEPRERIDDFVHESIQPEPGREYCATQSPTNALTSSHHLTRLLV
jgi:hypothetical protein